MDFICGVLEGFYGTPWRVSERKELFERLKNLDLNTYMYAPKDDSKHRKLWREKYTSSEKEILNILIKHAKSQGIEFVYAISPGLDVVFSSFADITALKEKLNQVYQIGCRSFALLFDDIDPELCLADKREFSSFGTAQVHVSNLLYEWFDELNLVLFCPTEYCITRAKPDVDNSEYLQCLGNDLNENIRIMWTAVLLHEKSRSLKASLKSMKYEKYDRTRLTIKGPKVVSKTIDTKSINALAKVLKRKPVIWDNIHANDYDQRRVFLGPFKGRPMELYECTSGILTNPNCEFECNFIAIHSLSTWLRVAKLFSEENKADSKIYEDENSNSSSCSGSTVSDNSNNQEVSLLYDSTLALNDAVDCWMELFQVPRDTIQGSKLHANKVSLDTVTNSLFDDEANENKVDKNDIDLNDKTIDDNVLENGELEDKVSENNEEITEDASPEKKARQTQLTSDDVLLLCDLYHLPYEHGEKGINLLADFKWLKNNAIDYSQPISKERVELWVEKSKEFDQKCQHVEDMYKRFMEICNKRILEQLFPYVNDVKETVYHLSKFVKWLGSVKRQNGSEFLPSDPEAWFYRGGLAEEMERLLPTPHDKMTEKLSICNQNKAICVIRPYLDEDKDALYQICRDLSAVPEAYQNCPELAGDSLIGAYLKYSPEKVFVIEVEDDLSGFISVCCDGKQFYEKVRKEWLPCIRKQYKKPDGNPDVWTPEQHMINRLFYPQFFTPDELFDDYNAITTFRLIPNVQKLSICRQAIKCIQSSVKKNLSCQIRHSLNHIYEPLLSDIGFTKITYLKDNPNDVILYGLKMK